MPLIFGFVELRNKIEHDALAALMKEAITNGSIGSMTTQTGFKISKFFKIKQSDKYHGCM